MVFRLVSPIAFAEACNTLRTSCAEAVVATRHTSAARMIARRFIRSSLLVVPSVRTYPARSLRCHASAGREPLSMRPSANLGLILRRFRKWQFGCDPVSGGLMWLRLAEHVGEKSAGDGDTRLNAAGD